MSLKMPPLPPSFSGGGGGRAAKCHRKFALLQRSAAHPRVLSMFRAQVGGGARAADPHEGSARAADP